MLVKHGDSAVIKKTFNVNFFIKFSELSTKHGFTCFRPKKYNCETHTEMVGGHGRYAHSLGQWQGCLKVNRNERENNQRDRSSTLKFSLVLSKG